MRVFRLDCLPFIISLSLYRQVLTLMVPSRLDFHLWWGLGDDFGLADGWTMLVFHLDCFSPLTSRHHLLFHVNVGFISLA
jgi:hypothetical protein